MDQEITDLLSSCFQKDHRDEAGVPEVDLGHKVSRGQDLILDNDVGRGDSERELSHLIG